MQPHQVKSVITPNGTYQIAHITSIPDHPSWYSHEDEKSVRERIWKVGEGDLVLDVGAAFGSYTLTALLRGAKRTYSWSPENGCGDTPERDFLERSLELNGWQHKGTVYNYGLLDKSGWLNTMEGKFYDTYPSIINHPLFFFEVKTLDSWYQNVFLKTDNHAAYNKTWMKLDVESAEVEVLKGARQLIQELKPIITVENHLFIRASIHQEVRDLLLPMGYTEHSTEQYHSVSHSLYLPVGS